VKKSIIILLTLLLFAVLPFSLTGCQPQEFPLRIAIAWEPISLDPFNVVDHLSPVIQQNIFEGLLTVAERNTLKPSLAREFSISPDGRAITFLLREGVQFHDGAKFDAAAVKVNFDFLLDPANAMARRNLFSFVEGIVVNSPYSITFKTTGPDYALAYYFAHPAASLKSPRELEKRMKDRDHNLTHTAVGTGPFRLRQWYGGKRLELVPNANYWNKEAVPSQGMTFFFVREASERLAMLKSGEIEIVYDLTIDEAEALRDFPAVGKVTLPRQELYFIGINDTLPQLRDARVRQAMNYAVDRRWLLRALSISGQAADGVVSPAVFGHVPLDAFTYDLARARELMRQAGLTRGFALTMHTPDSYIYLTTAKEVARQLSAINIEIEIVIHTAGELFTLLEQGAGVDLWVGSFVPYTGEVGEALRGDPDLALDAALEALLTETEQLVDRGAALAKYEQIQAAISRDPPRIYLFFPTRMVAVNASIRGVQSSPQGVLILRHASRGGEE